MGDVDVRESTRQSVLRSAAVANGNELANESAELVEVREKQLVQHFRRFYEEHLKIVAEVDGVNEDARRVNHELLSETEEIFMVARARLVRLIRQKQLEDQRAEAEENRLAAIERQAAAANAQRAIDEDIVNQAAVENVHQAGDAIGIQQRAAVHMDNQAADANVAFDQRAAPQQPMPEIDPQAAEVDEGLEGGQVEDHIAIYHPT